MLASPTYLPDMPKVERRYFQAMYYFYTDELAKLREQITAKGHECTEIVERFYIPRSGTSLGGPLDCRE